MDYSRQIKHVPEITVWLLLLVSGLRLMHRGKWNCIPIPVFGASRNNDPWGELPKASEYYPVIDGSNWCLFFCVSRKMPLSFSCSVVSHSLRPHGLQHTRPACPSPPPGAYSNSCPLSRWCYPTVSSFVTPLFSWPPALGVFSSESALHIRWPKYWSFSFSISPSSEYSGFISFRMDWFDLLAVQRTLRSLFQHHSSKYWPVSKFRTS